MEQLLVFRHEIAWLIFAENPKASHKVEMTLVYENRVKDYADRWPKAFKFDDLVGCVDFEGDHGYVTWGGMGVHLESVHGSRLRQAIKEQTGY